MIILYLCDCKKQCAAPSGCHNDDGQMRYCKHTSDPEHALYGRCADPENHPERFERMNDYKGNWTGLYVEKEVNP